MVTMNQFPKPALARMYRERAQRMVDNHRGYWDRAPGGGWKLICDPEKCKQKIKELREIANELESPERYEQVMEGYGG